MQSDPNAALRYHPPQARARRIFKACGAGGCTLSQDLRSVLLLANPDRKSHLFAMCSRKTPWQYIN